MKKYIKYLVFLMLVGCAGMERDCNSCNAGNFGADWLVVQYQFNGEPINCWKLNNVGISNETGSDGIFWLDSSTKHLVHISGWYNRVQVDHGDFDGAAKLLGVDLKLCKNGKYELPKVEEKVEKIDKVLTIPEQTISNKK